MVHGCLIVQRDMSSWLGSAENEDSHVSIDIVFNTQSAGSKDVSRASDSNYNEYANGAGREHGECMTKQELTTSRV